ncbi:MAG: hypothetical protein L0271_22670 [Gemmatimonadetes bacterium]|nr:hypothetical protein [Gemmatimonadota bacterium]
MFIDPRLNGPPGVAHGGYVAGRLAALFEGPVEVMLRKPVPLGRELDVHRAQGLVRLVDGEDVLVEARPVTADFGAIPRSPGMPAAEIAARGYVGHTRHAFPTCLVCGPARAPGDGFRIFAGPVAGADLVASPWIPDPGWADEDGALRAEALWASLDCPGAFAAYLDIEPRPVVLGRITARIDALPGVGERCVVIGWNLGNERRKHVVGTAVYGEGGELCAVARATWIEVRGEDWS